MKIQLPDENKARNKERAWAWAFGGCALTVLLLALLPALPQFVPSTGWDKTNHLLAFAVMTWLGRKAFPQRLISTRLGLLAYGALIEILQSFTPTRSAEWFDLLADGLGILMGWGLGYVRPASAKTVPSQKA